MLEKTYENKIKKFLKVNGAYFIKYFGCGFTQAGVPDILACINGRFVAIEIKADNGKPSPLQIENLKLIDACGGIAILLYPIDFENFKSLVLAINANKLTKKQYEYFRKQYF